jgi:hypothetical protein
MKCGAETCQNDAPEGRFYCHLHRGRIVPAGAGSSPDSSAPDDTRITSEDASPGTRPDTEQSPSTSESTENLLQDITEKTERHPTPQPCDPTTDTRRKTVNDQGRSIAERTPSRVSSGRRVTLSEAGCQSLILLDDCSSRLSKLMRIMLPRGKKNLRLDPQSANAVCSCAKQIMNITRLKLDIAREAGKE